ncbi:MAG: PIN domain-containing protein [Patescibacteria group bacterium]
MLFLIDSSVFVALFNDADPHVDLARLLFLTIEERGDDVVIPTLVIAEIAATLARMHALPDPGRFLATLSPFRATPVDVPFAHQFVHAVARSHISLKASDAIVVFTAHFSHAALITLDQQMIAQAAKYVSTFTPQQYIKLTSKESLPTRAHEENNHQPAGD